MEIGQKLDQTLVVFDILKFDLAQCFDLNFTVDTEHHLRLIHALLRCYDAGMRNLLGFILHCSTICGSLITRQGLLMGVDELLDLIVDIVQ